MKLKDFINGFRKLEYKVELATEVKPFVDSVAVAKLMNTLRHIPFYDIEFGIDEYKVEKEDNPTIGQLLWGNVTSECESFTKISCREIPYQNLRNFYVKNILYVIGIDNNIWKITVSAHIGGRVYTPDFDSYIVDTLIIYCNNYLEATNIKCILKTDCHIKFLQDKSKQYKKHILGYTVHESSSMLWTNGAREESYVSGFCTNKLLNDLDIKTVCPDYDVDDTFGMSISFTDNRMVQDKDFEKRLAEICNRDKFLNERTRPMIVPVNQ
jgi:hypothetical protein